MLTLFRWEASRVEGGFLLIDALVGLLLLSFALSAIFRAGYTALNGVQTARIREEEVRNVRQIRDLTTLLLASTQSTAPSQWEKTFQQPLTSQEGTASCSKKELHFDCVFKPSTTDALPERLRQELYHFKVWSH